MDIINTLTEKSLAKTVCPSGKEIAAPTCTSHPFSSSLQTHTCAELIATIAVPSSLASLHSFSKSALVAYAFKKV